MGIREAAKKIVARATKRGGAERAWPLRKKLLF